MTLREMRCAKDLSLMEASKRVNLRPSKLSDYEIGTDLPSTEEIESLAVVYEVTPDEVRNGLPAPEEAIAHAERVGKFLKSHRAAKDHAKQGGLGRGNGGQGTMPCPAGCGGQLRYSVASVNGHMHARCSTEGCVSWME